MSNHSNKAVNQAADPSQNWVSKLAEKRPIDGGKITLILPLLACSHRVQGALRYAFVCTFFRLVSALANVMQTNCKTCRYPNFCCCLACVAWRFLSNLSAQRKRRGLHNERKSREEPGRDAPSYTGQLLFFYKL